MEQRVKDSINKFCNNENWKNDKKSLEINDEIINEAFEKAWKDLMIRTLAYKEGCGNHEKAKNDCKKDIKDYLTKKLLEYFDTEAKKEDEFKNLHEDLCEEILKNLKQVYSNAEYGKAQKILNMVFKYLYCIYGEVDKYERHFEFCHMPLDSYILEWFARECKNRKSFDIDFKFVKSKMPSWSNIKNGNNSNDEKYSYQTFVDVIRELVQSGKYNGLTPLQAEFIIWPEIQLELAAEEFIKVMEKDINSENKTNIKDKDLKEKLNRVKDLLKEVL